MRTTTINIFKGIAASAILCFGVNASAQFKQSTPSYASLVNPFIGTGGHGHTYPGATVPFGMVQLSPDTRIDGSWDGCSGYHYSDSLIYGFSHTHLSGTGCTDYGDIMVMPQIGKVEVEPLKYASAFSHSSEIAVPGYYSVKLDKNSIDAEVSTTTRAGFHRYTFQKGQEQWVLLDLNHRDKLLEGNIVKVSDYAIQGYRKSESWASSQMIYFYMEFNQPIKEIIKIDEQVKGGRYGSSLSQSVQLNFGNAKSQLMVKVGVSGVSEEGAHKNLVSEIAGWDFAKVRDRAFTEWNKELSKIEVKGGSRDQQTIFYTALYHCMTQPNTFQDVDGNYRGRDFKVHKNPKGRTNYTVFSLWDTFRGLHPLLTLIDQKRTVDFINTFITQYKEGGRLPVWELSCNETECMIGYHAVPVIAEAMMKDLKGFNYKEAFEAAKHSAMMDHFGLEAYKKKGFIETDDEHESVSKTLEYAYDDWCIAQMAGKLGNKTDYDYFMKRSFAWVNLFDPTTQHMRPRYNGGWYTPFDPRQVDNNFTEANSWQYSFFVPHSVPELVKANGGLQRFESKLDELFSTSSKTTGREQSDISGLIGQYAHGNEPSHHMIYTYSVIGSAPKAQKQLRFILDNFYKNQPDGLIGNEDCGQMSAWYVWSAMGMYSFCPGKSYYTIGTPLFPSVTIHLENGREFTITRNGGKDEDFYIQKATLNGLALNSPTVQYSNIMNGGKLNFEMGATASDHWKLQKSEENKWQFNPAPLIVAEKQVFRDSLKVNVNSPQAFNLTVNGNQKNVSGTNTSFWIKESSNIAATSSGVENALTSNASFYKIPNNYTIKIAGKYNAQYTAGGDEALIDGLRGDENWRKGRWQGYQGQDVKVTIDMKKTKNISQITAGFLQDSRAWIVMPKEISVETSQDGLFWSKPTTVAQTDVKADDYTIQTKEMIVQKLARARFVRVTIKTIGKLPEWHLSAGAPAFFFLDEISIK